MPSKPGMGRRYSLPRKYRRVAKPSGRPKNGDPRRIPVDRLRALVEAKVNAGEISYSRIAQLMGWTYRYVQRRAYADGTPYDYEVIAGDARKLGEVLGRHGRPSGQRRNGGLRFNRTIDADMAEEIARICRIDPALLHVDASMTRNP